MLGPKKFWVQKFLGQNKFGSKWIWSKKFWLKEIFGPKNLICARKVFGKKDREGLSQREGCMPPPPTPQKIVGLKLC